MRSRGVYAPVMSQGTDHGNGCPKEDEFPRLPICLGLASYTGRELRSFAACQFQDSAGRVARVGGDSMTPIAFLNWDELLDVPQARPFSAAKVFGMIERRQEAESINPPLPDRGPGRPLGSSFWASNSCPRHTDPEHQFHSAALAREAAAAWYKRLRQGSPCEGHPQ